jgi:predicted dehydrogenase
MLCWGLIGCGDISNKRVAPAIQAQLDSILLAAMSPFKAELEGFQARHNVPRGYLSAEEMLADKDIQAVYVATPIFLHYGLALQALRSGKHVLVEKPMAMTPEECDQLVQEASKQNVKLGVAYFRRFFPKFDEIKRLIAEGVIGDVIQIRITFHSNYNPAENDPKRWRVVKAKGGGGPLWDMGCHKLDILVDLFGMPKTVYAFMDTLTHPYEVEDSCSALMKMENGAHCIATFNWNSAVWNDEIVILGTNGKILLSPSDDDSITLELTPREMKGIGREVTTVLRPNEPNVHAPLVDDFSKAVLEARTPRISGAEGMKTNRILWAIEESAITGKQIEL